MYGDALENVRQCVEARRERKRLTGVCAMMEGRHWRTPPEMSRSGTSAKLPHPTPSPSPSAVLGDRIEISVTVREKHPRSVNNTSNDKQTKRSASEGLQCHQS